jgi:hypothetical protein
MSVFMKWIRGSAAIGGAMLIGSSLPASAGYVVTLEEVPDNAVPLGSDVVATGSGAIDLIGLSSSGGPGIATALIRPKTGDIVVASGIAAASTGITGPLSFGTGDLTFASSSSGGAVAMSGSGDLIGAPGIGVPDGYMSGSALSDTSTYNNATFSSLGVTPGTYEWTWGTGGANQNFTLQIGPAAAVPEPASVLLLAGALVGFVTLLGVGSRAAARSGDLAE